MVIGLGLIAKHDWLLLTFSVQFQSFSLKKVRMDENVQNFSQFKFVRGLCGWKLLFQTWMFDVLSSQLASARTSTSSLPISSPLDTRIARHAHYRFDSLELGWRSRIPSSFAGVGNVSPKQFKFWNALIDIDEQKQNSESPPKKSEGRRSLTLGIQNKELLQISTPRINSQATHQKGNLQTKNHHAISISSLP